MKSGGIRPPATADPDVRTPVGITLGAGAVTIVAAVIVAATIPPSYADWRFAVMALTVGGFAAWTLDRVALAGVAGLAWLVTNGFLVDRFGQLAWHGSADLYRALMLATAGALGLVAGESYRQVRALRAHRRARVEAGFDWPVAVGGFDEEARRNA